MLNDVSFPLQRIDREFLLEGDLAGEEARRVEKRKLRDLSLMQNPEQISSRYPLVYEAQGRILRYTLLPALEQSKGLVVLFHGYKGFLHLGAMEAWPDFDILAPWDTFGWQRKGSWFFGEKGEPITETLVRGLIARVRAERTVSAWFCMGGSMGGFASLYFGIKEDCDGIYASEPQIDLSYKVEDYDVTDPTNPYLFLQGATPDSLPNVFALAEAKKELPPLYLVQQQYDKTNYFAEHGFRLLEIYNRKRAWYGARIAPGIGHKSDPSQAEARYFFNALWEKRPPRRVPFAIRGAE